MSLLWLNIQVKIFLISRYPFPLSSDTGTQIPDQHEKCPTFQSPYANIGGLSLTPHSLLAVS